MILSLPQVITLPSWLQPSLGFLKPQTSPHLQPGHMADPLRAHLVPRSNFQAQHKHLHLRQNSPMRLSPLHVTHCALAKWQHDGHHIGARYPQLQAPGPRGHQSIQRRLNHRTSCGLEGSRKLQERVTKCLKGLEEEVKVAIGRQEEGCGPALCDW